MRISDWSSDVCSSDLDELKLVQCRIPDIPAHGIGEIDDILVAGEHQLLARACRNIYGADFLHIYDLHRIERRGKAPGNARPPGSGIAANPCPHAALLWPDALDAGQRAPDNRDANGTHAREPLASRSAGQASPNPSQNPH